MLKFMYNGIKLDGKLFKAWYSNGKLNRFPEGTITIYANTYTSFPDIDGLNVENQTDTYSDYFEKDKIRVEPTNIYYNEVLAAFNKQKEHSQKKINKKTETTKESVLIEEVKIIEVKAETKDNIKSENKPNNIDVKIDGDYITIKTNGKPDAETLEKLRNSKFKWKSFEKVWKAWNNESNMNFANSLISSQGNTTQEMTQDKIETIANVIIDRSVEIITSLNLRHNEYENNDEYLNQLAEVLKGYKVTKDILNYITYEGLESLTKVIIKLIGGFNPEPPPKKANKERLINKIDSRIQTISNQLNKISGEYLTNTRKRIQEEKSRQMARELFQQQITFLEYLKNQIEQDQATNLEIALISKSFKETLSNMYYMKYSKHNQGQLIYPSIDPNRDLEHWYNVNQQEKINRLKKNNINTIQDLQVAVDEYKNIIEKINKPINQTQKKIKEMEMELKMHQKDNIHFTPKEIIEHMINNLELTSNNTVLEPSAGIGNILDQVSKVSNTIDCIEINGQFRELLKMKNYNLIGDDFLKFNSKSYDKIIMNPPFSNNQDITHLKHAYSLLNDTGKMVCLTSNHWTFANDKESVNFREWINDKNYYVKDFQAGMFERTNISVKMVVIEKTV